MANSFNTTPDNFGKVAGNGSVTRYLDLAGLTSFWGKVKTYVDDQDAAVLAIARKELSETDATLRSYVESLEVNGVKVSASASVQGGKNDKLTVVIKGSDIEVGGAAHGGADYESTNYAASTVAEAIHDLDKRADAIQIELKNGVVSGLKAETVHGKYGPEATATDKAWVDVTGSVVASDYQTGKLDIKIDDTAINDQFKSIDGQIADLIANAGVTNIKVVDTNKTDAVNKGLVEISMTGTKAAAGTAAGDDTFKRGDITITLDESGLDQKLDGVDATIAAEVSDRKEDVANLAGEGYTAAAGETAGAWDEDVKYTNITSLSDRLAQIDENLVTTINVVDTDKQGSKNYVVFTKADSAGDKGGDNSVTLTVNESALDEYIAKNEDNLQKLADTAREGGKVLTVNNKTLVGVTIPADGSQVSVAGSSIVLTTEDINRPGATGANLEETLSGYDAAIEALASATHFRGVTKSAITDGGSEQVTIEGESSALVPIDGDIVISMNAEGSEGVSREYVWYSGKWYELGDTTAEAQRLTDVEEWIDENFISPDDINGLNWTASIVAPTV